MGEAGFRPHRRPGPRADLASAADNHDLAADNLDGPTCDIHRTAGDVDFAPVLVNDHNNDHNNDYDNDSRANDNDVLNDLPALDDHPAVYDPDSMTVQTGRRTNR